MTHSDATTYYFTSFVGDPVCKELVTEFTIDK